MKNDISDFHFRVVIKFREFLCLRYYGVSEENHRLSSYGSRWRRHLSQIVRGKKINKLFTSLTPERIVALTCKAVKLDPSYQPPNFSHYYSVGCDGETEAAEITESLTEQDIVEHAYIETHSASPPSINFQRNPLSRYQEYLNPAPSGIDAKYAWEFSGGNGSGNVRFIDIEQGWIFDHEDLRVSRLPSTGWSHWQHEDHGTGVLGVILMQDNTVGGIGITPQANGFVVSQWRPDGTFNTADAIMAGVDSLYFGDIILLEAQTYDVLRTKKVWPVEAFDANFQAIRLATALGVAVVEAAGNSMNTMGNDLDLFRDGKEQSIFNRSSDHFKDSGAIIVAAGSSDVPHARINYSN